VRTSATLLAEISANNLNSARSKGFWIWAEESEMPEESWEDVLRLSAAGLLEQPVIAETAAV